MMKGAGLVRSERVTGYWKNTLIVRRGEVGALSLDVPQIAKNNFAAGEVLSDPRKRFLTPYRDHCVNTNFFCRTLKPSGFLKASAERSLFIVDRGILRRFGRRPASERCRSNLVGHIEA